MGNYILSVDDLPDNYKKQALEKLEAQNRKRKPKTEPAKEIKPKETKKEETAKKPAKTSKYKNKKVEINGITFDSKKEAARYETLLAMMENGEISNLKLQHTFTLQESFKNYKGERVNAIKYIADFTYYKGNEFIVEDVKSAITRKNPLYILKKKLMAEKGYFINEE